MKLVNFLISIWKLQRQFYTAAAKSLQSCPTPCDPIDGSPPGSRVPGDSPGKNTRVGCHFLLQCMKVRSESAVIQSCLTLSDPMVCSLPGSSVHGILQARVLEWGAIAFSEFYTHQNHCRQWRRHWFTHFSIWQDTKKCIIKYSSQLHWIWTTLDKSKSWHNFSKFEEETSSPKSVSPIQISCLNWQDFEVWLNHNRNKEYQHINLVGHSIKARN